MNAIASRPARSATAYDIYVIVNISQIIGR